MNLTYVFLDSAPVRERLPFGVNDNVFLRSISTEKRKDKDGNKLKKNCFITFSKKDLEEDKIVAEYTFSFFDVSKLEYAVKSLIQQTAHLVAIMDILIPADELEDLITKVLAPLEDSKEVKKALETEKAKKLKPLLNAQEAIVLAFADVMTPFIGEDSTLFQLLVVTNKTGKFIELPSESIGFISSMDGAKLNVPPKYKRWYLDGLKPETDEADDIGNDDIISDEDINIEDDDADLEDI